MNVKRRNKPFGDIDVTSFSDLAFLLIIFFVLTTTFQRPEGVRITLPSQTNNAELKAKEDPPTLNLSMDKLLLNQAEVSLDELRTRLADMQLAKREESGRVIILDCADDVSFERYYPVVTAVSKAGGILALVETIEDGKSSGADAQPQTEAPAEAPSQPQPQS